MGFKCGIVGLPNVGKSTLFNALARANIAATNFPFCTIKPNTGVVPVPDLRLNLLAELVKPQRIMPTTMEFVDIAGLVKGASRGEGLGNQFLINIRETEAICHVVRCFENDNIIHVAGKISPVEDITTINTELALSDLDTCKRAIHRISKKTKVGGKNTKKELIVLEKCLTQLEDNKMLRTLHINKEEKELISHLKFLTLKPSMYIANIDENRGSSNSYLDLVCTVAEQDGSAVVLICAVVEADIARLNDNDRNEYIVDLDLAEPGLNRVIRTGYALLNLQTFFTVGIKEIRAWTIPTGTTALQAAGKIHNDFAKGFIRVQTVAFEDFINYKGTQGAKEAGKMRAEGKNYIVRDGDVMNFLFNV